jgi:hypothetical protein
MNKKQTYNIVKEILKKYDLNSTNPSMKKILSNIQISISLNEEIRLISFTCSTINDKYMFDQKKPWLYVNANTKGNNLENDLPILKELLIELNSIYPVKLIIIIGNTDPYYIYSESFSIYKNMDKNVLWQNFYARWSKYEKNFIKWLTEKSVSNFDVINWYKFEKNLQRKSGIDFDALFNKNLPKINKFFPSSDFQWELKKLKTAFGKNQYFPSLTAPKEKVLKTWIRRKFTEYMLQGLLIYIIFPRAILIQNEKPSLLRYKMYQPLIRLIFNDELPNIFPFGIDNIGYQ